MFVSSTGIKGPMDARDTVTKPLGDMQLLSKHMRRRSASLMNGELQMQAPAKSSATPTAVLSREKKKGKGRWEYRRVKFRKPL